MQIRFPVTASHLSTMTYSDALFEWIARVVGLNVHGRECLFIFLVLWVNTVG